MDEVLKEFHNTKREVANVENQLRVKNKFTDNKKHEIDVQMINL